MQKNARLRHCNFITTHFVAFISKVCWGAMKNYYAPAKGMRVFLCIVGTYAMYKCYSDLKAVV